MKIRIAKDYGSGPYKWYTTLPDGNSWSVGYVALTSISRAIAHAMSDLTFYNRCVR